MAEKEREGKREDRERRRGVKKDKDESALMAEHHVQ